jgi:hypothetical protein
MGKSLGEVLLTFHVHPTGYPTHIDESMHVFKACWCVCFIPFPWGPVGVEEVETVRVVGGEEECSVPEYLGQAMLRRRQVIRPGALGRGVGGNAALIEFTYQALPPVDNSAMPGGYRTICSSGSCFAAFGRVVVVRVKD